MNPDALAHELAEELNDLFEDEGWRCRVTHVTAPPDLGPDQDFEVRLRNPSGAVHTHILSAGLVAAYFADEEAAVDQIKAWSYALPR